MGKVVREFGDRLPGATIYVFDNKNTNGTAARTLEAGAIRRSREAAGERIGGRLDAKQDRRRLLRHGGRRRHYPSDVVEEPPAPLLRNEADMAVGQRLSVYTDASFRPPHLWENRLVRDIIKLIFNAKLTDMVTGRSQER